MTDANLPRELERIERALRRARAGAWELMLPSRRAWFSSALRSLLDADEQMLPNTLEALEARVHPEDLDRVRAALEHQRDEPGPFRVEFRARARDGRFLWFQAVGSGARADGEVRVAGLLGHADLRREPGRERGSTSRASFLAAMSHEIRTPMTAILGFADLLRDAATPEGEFRAAAESIHRNGEHLLKIVNDILDLSRIEAGAMTIEEIAVAPVDLVREVCDSLRPRAAAAGLELTVELLGAVPALIRSDPTRLRQILLNLVDNALKFTDRGFVRVGLERGPGETLRIHVTDTGIGISAEQLDRIFRPFAQGDLSTPRRYGGSGLGLDISRRLARMLGGEITVRSTQGRGSTFTVEVATGPLAGVPTVTTLSAGARAPASGVPRGRRLLLAEDGLDSQRLLRHLLERDGWSVTIVDNGRAAVDSAIDAWRRGAAFDLMLMDMEMPEMDGVEATRALRGAGLASPIIALTAHDAPGERERWLAAGCDDVLTKPIDRRRLLDAISRSVDQVP